VSGFLDTAPLEIDCPSCGRTVRTTIGAVRRSPRLRCSSGHEIDVDVSQFDRELKMVDRSLADFEKSLKRLGG
jgi:lysyl-tRNA synthetase class I